MNALELADQLDHDSDIGEFKHYEASAMLRKQHEEIKRLRMELGHIATANPKLWDEEVRDQFQPWAQSRARAALAATEDVCANS